MVLAHRIRVALAQPYLVAGHSLLITSSVGLSVSEPGSTAEGLLGRADAEMYSAKAARTTFDEITNPVPGQ